MIILELALYFALLSCIAFDGLPSVLPEMQRFVVDVKGWASGDDFIRLFAIAQAAPGPNILFASLVGWKVAGLAGAVVSLASICGPAAVISWWVSGLWEKYKEAPWRIALQRAIARSSSALFCPADMCSLRPRTCRTGGCGSSPAPPRRRCSRRR